MLLNTFADYAFAEQRRDLPADVVHQTKRAVIDWFAAVIPGGIIAPATLLERALAEDMDRGKAFLYPSGRRTTVRTAALINGSASHTTEFDDIFRDGIYHPGSPIIAAALASAQHQAASGETFLRAVIIGYEISTRIGVAVNPAHYKFWHTTGTVGTLGAAAAVGAILRLNIDRFINALATAGTFAAGLQQAFRSDAMSKPLHAGHAAEAGTLAALAAAEGVTGAPDILEGEYGFGNAMAGRCDWLKAVDGLGTRYNITQMTIKNHGCCGHTFAAIDGVLAIRERNRLEPGNIRRIRIGTYKTAIDVAGSYEVTTAFEGKFSLPYVVAVALVHGRVRLDAFSSERLQDPMVRNLMSRVELYVDPELDAMFPAQRAARVAIETTDGRHLEHFQPTRKGDPDAPLTDNDLNDKFMELAGGVLGEEGAGRLLKDLWRLEEFSSVYLSSDKEPLTDYLAALKAL